MQSEPAISHEQLAQLIETAYTLRVRSLSFLPIGVAAACYRVESAAGHSILKLWLAPLITPMPLQDAADGAGTDYWWPKMQYLAAFREWQCDVLLA